MEGLTGPGQRFSFLIKSVVQGIPVSSIRFPVDIRLSFTLNKRRLDRRLMSTDEEIEWKGKK
jgi:hypothetical protein